MKRLLFLLMFTVVTGPLLAQYVYTINADSVKITNHCDTAELILENHTQNVPGFLFNKGRGRTEFRRGLFSIDDTLYLIGGDTLNLGRGLNALTGNNGVLRTGNTFQFGNDATDPYGGLATQIRPTYYNQNSSTFNWMTGGSGIFTVAKGQYTEVPTSILSGYYLARFASPQGGILLEGNVRVSNGPLQWINYKNTEPTAVKHSFFGDSIAAQIGTNAYIANDSRVYTNYTFLVNNDTTYTNNANEFVLKLFPTTTSGFGTFKVPSAVATRLDIEDNIGCTPCMSALNNSNPYSRFVVDAKNYPLVAANLPQSASGGHALIIDNDGKIWQGDSTGGQPAAWSLTGNSGTTPGTNFIGTTDYQPLSISTNSTEAINIQPTGYVGIGTSNPLTKVQIYKAGEDGQLAVTGDAPSMRLWGPTADYTSGTTISAVLGLGTTIADYSADAVAGDLVLSDYQHNAIIFSTNYLATYQAHTDEKMRIDGDGHVGINTKNPTAKLHVVDSVRFENLPAGSGNYLLIDGDGYLHVSVPAAAVPWPDSINSSLAVNGNISAHRLTLQQAAWPDYVFDSAYHRPSLAELDRYIKYNNHLPGIPAATEIAKKGIDVGDNQAALLKKIEEMTLYLIDQEKKWQAQDEIVKKQNKELETLKQEMDEIKKAMTKKP